MWIARDRDGYLCAYGSKPHRGSNEWSSIDKYKVDDTVSIEIDTIAIDGRLFPELKWENEPIEVELCISNKNTEKYNKLRKLAYDMYTKMQNLSTDLRPLRESMEKFHHFICFEEKNENEIIKKI